MGPSIVPESILRECPLHVILDSHYFFRRSSRKARTLVISEGRELSGWELGEKGRFSLFILLSLYSFELETE